ncbi:MAG: ATP-binding protein [Trueperaceae bacterium]
MSATAPAALPAWWDQLHEGVVLLDGGHVTMINRAAADLLGVGAASASGRPAFAVLRDHRIEGTWNDGRTRRLDVRGRRVEVRRIEGGLSIRDVDAATRAQQHARELLAVLSHELRTPATAIVSTLEALAYDDLPATTRERLTGRAAEEGARLVRLLHDLTVDVRPPRERTIETDALVQRAVTALGPTLTRHRVRVRSEIGPPTVRVDGDKLLQVLVNLIENAAVHGPNDADVQVRIVVADASGTVHVTVRDAGTPLPPGSVEKLFALHAQGPSPKRRGTGLGLWVVRSIAEGWGGRAWGRPVATEADAPGNEFGVSLPQPG